MSIAADKYKVISGRLHLWLVLYNSIADITYILSCNGSRSNKSPTNKSSHVQTWSLYPLGRKGLLNHPNSKNAWVLHLLSTRYIDKTDKNEKCNLVIPRHVTRAAARVARAAALHLGGQQFEPPQKYCRGIFFLN